MDVDSLAQMIRTVDGNHDLGAGALAERLLPMITAAIASAPATVDAAQVVGYANRNEFAMEGCAGFMCSKRPPLTDASFFTIPLYTTPQPPSPPTDSGERGDGLPEPAMSHAAWGATTITDYYTADQMHAYAQQCRSARVEEKS